LTEERLRALHAFKIGEGSTLWPYGSFQESVGRVFGPFEREGRTGLFVKRSSGAPRVPPLDEITDVVRRDLLRENSTKRK